jgi:hypothetical protein
VKHFSLRYINSVWNKEELHDQWKECIIVPFYKKVIKLTLVIIMGYHCQVHIYMKLLGIISVGLDVTDTILIRIF